VADVRIFSLARPSEARGRRESEERGGERERAPKRARSAASLSPPTRAERSGRFGSRRKNAKTKDMANDLFIDRAVRDWVFVPLTIFIILMKLIMQYVHVVRLSPLSKKKKKRSRRFHRIVPLSHPPSIKPQHNNTNTTYTTKNR
jgi:hypothetical protein